MNVFIIIVTYNGSKWIEKCLQSVLKSNVKLSIIIVDNNSNDNTKDIIENRFIENVLLIKSEKNLGFGAANNIGIAYAQKNNADFVFLLNQDAYVEPDTIKNLIVVSEKYPQYGILSPVHFNGSGLCFDGNFYYYFSFLKGKEIFFDFFNQKIKEVYDVPFVNAAAWLLPKKTIEDIGGFDPIFFHYGEDENYCQRVRYFNRNICIVPEAIIYHDREDRGTKIISEFSNQYFVNFENSLKVKYADLNVNFNHKEKVSEKKAILKKLLKSLMLLRLKSIIGNWNQYNKLTGIFSKIEGSRLISKVSGMKYLE